MDYNVKLDLLKLRHAFVARIKGKAETKECICIPLDTLYVGLKGVHLDLNVKEMQTPRFEDTHYIKQQLQKEVRASLTEEEKKAIPICGGMRASKFQQNGINVSQTAEVVPYEDNGNIENEDLPF